MKLKWMMNLEIIPLETHDISRLNHLYADIFQKKNLFNQAKIFKKSRDPEFWKMYLTKNSIPTIGLINNSKLIGFSCIHTLGNFFWAGPLGIDKTYQRKGLGKMMISAQINSLFKNHEVNFSLESTQEIQNFAFYTKCGFQFDKLVVRIAFYPQNSKVNSKKATIAKLNTHDIQRFEILHLLRQQYKLDYTNEIKSYLDYGYGDFLAIEYENKVIGFGLVQKKAPFTSSSKIATCKALILNTHDKKIIDHTIQSLINFYFSQNYACFTLNLFHKDLPLINLFEKIKYKIYNYNFFMKHEKSKLELPAHDFFLSLSWSG